MVLSWAALERCRLHRMASHRLFSSMLDDPIRSFHPRYLRAMDPLNFDRNTFQRTDVAFDLKTGKAVNRPCSSEPHTYPSIQAYTLEDNVYQVQWDDGQVSHFPIKSIEEMLSRAGRGPRRERVLWKSMTEEKFRSPSSGLSMSFGELLSEAGLHTALQAIYTHGILLVRETPTEEYGASIAALASALGGGAHKTDACILKHYLSGNPIVSLPLGTDGPMRTLYGTVWSTSITTQSAGTSTSDSSYGSGALPLHTDLTYYQDPPGLQIFTMLQPAATGGESVYCDGFQVADRMQRDFPDSFHVLSQTPRHYRCVDVETGWHLEAHAPVFSVSNGRVVAVRHNDLDRIPDLPPANVDDLDAYYDKLQEAHHVLDDILSEDEMRLVVGLEPGETVVVVNQRCLHGRLAFESKEGSPRVVSGCYVSNDEVNSRLRHERLLTS